MNVGDAAEPLDLVRDLLELVCFVRATSSTVPPASPISSAAALPIPDDAPVIITVRPLTASGSERASTSPAPGMRWPKARSVCACPRRRCRAEFGGAIVGSDRTIAAGWPGVLRQHPSELACEHMFVMIVCVLLPRFQLTVAVGGSS